MANLTRYKQKIFANNSNQVGVFGTGVNKVASKNVETLQSSDYEDGWSAAVVTNKNYPIWQERDGVDYGFSYQLAYLMQKGIPEWLSTETYYQNDFCRLGNTLYRSLADNNTNKNPTNTSGYWTIYSGNESQITNCLLQVPQRIKYTLVDGTLTILQGSVLVIPYGTTDLSSTYTVGSTFINSGLKVVDRKYNNGQFFVWAELQADLVRASSSSASVAQRRAVVQIASGSLSVGNFANTASVSSDAGATQSSVLFYNTTENLVKSKSSGTISTATCSLPLMITESDTTYNIAKIKQVFNGFGFIGSVAWADKGVKYLLPNGLNDDGSLNNSELTLTNISIRDLGITATSVSRYLTITIARQISFAGLGILYDKNRNVNYNSFTGEDYQNCVIGMLSVDADGNISALNADTALNINMISDGRWIASGLSLAQGVTYPTDNDITYDLSSYLPNDGCQYQVLVSASVATGTALGDRVDMDVTTDIMPNNVFITSAVATVANRTNRSNSFGLLYVGTGRTLTIKVNTEDLTWLGEQWNGRFNLYANGYRRLGANI